ncbi:Nn.00g091680.m01.CDS01 [Neocucurbitaria sp. VM-36]
MVVTTTSITVAPGDRVRKLYKCSTCTKVFRRSEHCIRHERAHTQERPFACCFCHKTYARKDLVKRHERTIHAAQYEAFQAAAVNAEQQAIQHESTVPGAALETPNAPSPASASASAPAPDTLSIPLDGHSDAASANQAKENEQAPQLPIDPGSYTQLETSHPSTEQVGPQYVYSLPSPLTGDSNETIDAIHDASFAARNDFHLDSLGFLDNTVHDHGEQRSNKQPCLDTASTSNFLTMPVDTGDDRLGAPQSTFESFDISLFADIFTMDATCPMLTFPCTPTSSDGTSQEQHAFSPNDQSETATDSARNHQNLSLTHSRRLFRHLPHVLQEKSHSPPRLEIDQATYQTICNDVMSCMVGQDCQQTLPTIQELRRFLVGYTDCFHRHLPIVHLPSLVLAETPSALLLAFSCIGALYRLDRRRAASIFQLSVQLLQKVEVECTPTQATTPLALWAIQTRLLLTIFSLFTGDAPLITAEFQRLGFYLTDYRLRKTLISRTVVPTDQTTWGAYVQRESHKRVLCAINIMSNLAMVVYDVTPGFISPEDWDFEMPDEEHLWNARTEAEWHQLRKAHHKQQVRSLRSILTDIISGNYKDLDPAGDQTYQLTTFGGLVLMHAISLHLWTSLQFTRAIGLYSNVGMVGNVSLRATVLSAGIATLSRCQNLLFCDEKEEKPVEPSWDFSEGQLLFSCQAVLRIACTRLFLPDVPFRRIVMITGTEEDMDEAASAYVTCPLERNEFYAKAAAKACLGFLTPVHIGHLLVRKTAAFGWSIEHAVAGWDSALFLTKWIHTIEIESSIIPPTREEQSILSELKESLREIDYTYSMHTSLAATVARAWAPFLTDVWDIEELEYYF